MIKSIYKDKSLLDQIIKKQKLYSDKDVFKNIKKILGEIFNEKIDIGKKENIHLIGIGGIGMSGLAKIMKTIGLKVQGSDLKK